MTRDLLSVLFPTGIRLRLAFAAVASIIVSIIETGSLLLLVPLIQLLSNPEDRSGALNLVVRITGVEDTATLMWLLLGGALAGFVGKDVFTLVARWWTTGFLGRQQIATSAMIFRSMLLAPYVSHRQRTLSDRIRSVGEAVALFYGRIVGGGLALLTEAITLVAMLVAMAIVAPTATLAATVYFAFFGLLYVQLVRPRIAAETSRALDAGRTSMEYQIWGFGAISEIQVRHSEEHFVRELQKSSLIGMYAARLASFLTELPKYVLEILFITGIGLVLFTLQLTGSGPGTYASLAVLGAASFRILPSLSRLIAGFAILRSGLVGRDLLVKEFSVTPPTQGPATATTSRTRIKEQIAFEGVSFRYPDGTKDVLKGVDLVIPHGRMVALVGTSGAGKTTMGNLLLGLLVPTRGRITVDGVDIRSHLMEWQNCIGFVAQDVFLMDATLRENIAFDQLPSEIDDERIMEAVTKAQLGDFVDEHGLSARFGEMGSRMSGGQKQRIGIARALYRRPDLLLLDEATSALDNATEQRIAETVMGLRDGMTIVVIAHRLSTVRDADEIVFMQDGRISDRGTFDELRSRNESFAELVRLGSLTTAPLMESGVTELSTS